MSTFPSVLTSYTDPAATNRLNSPSHSSIESAQNSGLSQLEAVIGVAGASSVVGSYEYLIKSPASNGGGHVQSANKGGTGQTSFNKGDILVAQSSSVLSKLAVGPDGAVLKSNSSVASGIQWGSVPGSPTVRVYGYSSSVITWNKPSVLSYIVVEVQGGGGGGGGTTIAEDGSSGGGGGGYARKTILASVLGTTEPVVVGVGGTAGAGSGGDGGGGGTTGFGTPSILYATGGGAGSGDPGYAGGGVGSGGDLNLYGCGGETAIDDAETQVRRGGGGGNSFLGFGGRDVFGDAVGNNGTLYGGGGGGGVSAGSDRAGGAGAAGVVIITEY